MAEIHGEASPFARALRRARLAAELTQEELAERAGVSARAISDLERGVNRSPRRDTIELIVEALKLDAGAKAALEATVVRARRSSESPSEVTVTTGGASRWLPHLS